MSGGTNSKIKQQNKAVKKQFKYDRQYHDYTEKVNEKRYEKAVADTRLQQANYDAQRLFKDAIKRQQFEYQSDLQKRQFDLDKQVYLQALEDYDNQVELNDMSAAIARASTERAEREALIKRNFDLETQDLNQQSQSLDIAENRRGLLQQSAELGFDQRQARSQLTGAEEAAGFETRRLASDMAFATDSRNVQRFGNRSNLKFSQETSALDNRQLSSDMTAATENRSIRQGRNRSNMTYATDTRGIAKGRNLSDLTFAEESSATNLASLDSKERFERRQAALEQKDVSQEKDFVSDSSRRRVEKLAIQNDKLNEDIRYIEDSSGIDVKSIQLVYDKKQAANYNQRIDTLIKRTQEEGKARASGREGLSADRSRVDALAAYGRSQAQLVENLVFAKDERSYELGKTTLSRDYQSTLKGKDKDILQNDRSLELLTRDRQLGKLDITSSKITNALEETVAQIGFDRDRTKSSLRKAQREYSLTDRQIDADYNKSAREFSLTDRQIDSDYSKTKRDYRIAKDRTASKLRKDTREFNIGERKIKANYDNSVRNFQIGKDASASKLRQAQREFGIGSDRRGSQQGFIDQRLSANAQRRTIFDQRNNLSNRMITL